MRHDDISTILAPLSGSERAAVLQALDLISRPLVPREMDHALRDAGLTVTLRKRVMGATKHLSIVAIVDAPRDPEGGSRKV